MKRYLLLASILLASVGAIQAQEVGVKTNILYWGSATPNLGMEFALADRWTVDVSGGYNPWTFNEEENLKWKHWLVSPEVRYWFCESFHGHFIGINGNYTQFNISGLPLSDFFINLHSNVPQSGSLKNSRINGWAVGAGITYGHQFIISRRWNLELTAGFGWWYTEYDQFESRKCGLFQQRVKQHALGLTSLGISFIYIIK